MESHVCESSEEVQLATREQLFNLLAFLDGKLPDCCAIYNHVLISLWTSNPIYKIHFLRDSNGGYRAIVGLKRDGCLNHQNEIQIKWTVTSWAEDEETRIKVYGSIKDINWEADEFLVTGLDEPHPTSTALFAGHGRVLSVHNIDLFAIDRQTALNAELETPDDVYIKSLETRHAATVYDNWALKRVANIDSVVDCIVESPSAGLFVKETNELVSWMTSHVPNGMSKLHTLEEFRHRGYARLVTQYLAKRVAQAGYLPFATIDPSNEASKKCFRSAGFSFISSFHIFSTFRPHSK